MCFDMHMADSRLNVRVGDNGDGDDSDGDDASGSATTPSEQTKPLNTLLRRDAYSMPIDLRGASN